MKKNIVIFILFAAVSFSNNCLDNKPATTSANQGAQKLPQQIAQSQQDEKVLVDQPCNRAGCKRMALKKCSGCGVFYCTIGCQRLDCRGHKSRCMWLRLQMLADKQDPLFIL